LCVLSWYPSCTGCVPRCLHDALPISLSRHGARVIGFDIAFSEPDENSQVALIDQLARRVDALAIRDRRLAAFISESRRHADNDRDRKSTRLNSSHGSISYAAFCLQKT